MPDWLIEGRAVVYLALALVFVACAWAWQRSQRRIWAICAMTMAVLGVGYFLLDRAYESDREQIVRKLGDIAAAVTRRDIDAAFENVSSSFLRGGVDKVGFRSFADSRRRSDYVTDVQIWDIAVDPLDRAARRAVAECSFKVRGSFGETPPGSFARITFALDPDGQWRVQNFDWFQSITDSNTPMPIPGWGSGR